MLGKPLILLLRVVGYLQHENAQENKEEKRRSA
jgi:hypothetical protein